MDASTRHRILMTAIGAIAGLALYALFELLDQSLLPPRLAMWLLCFVAVFSSALLALTGPLAFAAAALRAAGLAVGLAMLMLWAGFRFDVGTTQSQGPLPFLAGLLLASLPLPFLIAHAGPGLRHYPTLFTQSWTILVRFTVASAFVGVVWLVVFLSDALLGIVGVTLIGDLIGEAVVACTLSGAILGLGLAVVAEMSGLVSPHLVLRLLRLLLPVVVPVMAVFLLAVPVQGLSGLFQDLSAGLILLSMAGAGIALVSTAVDQTDAEAAHHPMITGSARAVCLMLPLLAALGGWAVWQRVAQYGWTPERLCAALVAVFALAYGVVYAQAALSRMGWRNHVRQGNTVMAMLLMAVAVLWLTPVLNAERISARSQLERFLAGQTDVPALDLAAISEWGSAGLAVRGALERMAAEPGQDALAARLATEATGAATGAAADPEIAIAALVQVLPLQPPTATATRDILLAGLSPQLLTDWSLACGRKQPGGKPGCLMVVADLWPNVPGEEAIMVLDQGGWAMMQGLALRDGVTETRQVWQGQGGMNETDSILALMALWQAEPPPLTPAPLNQIGFEGGAILLP